MTEVCEQSWHWCEQTAGVQNSKHTSATTFTLYLCVKQRCIFVGLLMMLTPIFNFFTYAFSPSMLLNLWNGVFREDFKMSRLNVTKNNKCGANIHFRNR